MKGRPPYKRGSLVRDLKTGKQPVEVVYCCFVNHQWMVKLIGSPYLRFASDFGPMERVN